MNADKTRFNETNLQHIEDLLYLYLKNAGSIIPTTTDDVAIFENMLEEESIYLSDEQLEHDAVLAHGALVLSRQSLLKRSSNTEIEMELARAAREGRKITEDIEQRMRNDRNHAEQERLNKNANKN